MSEEQIQKGIASVFSRLSTKEMVWKLCAVKVCKENKKNINKLYRILYKKCVGRGFSPPKYSVVFKGGLKPRPCIDYQGVTTQRNLQLDKIIKQIQATFPRTQESLPKLH